ncbi:unnamed protein product, partial [Effrenium voratum]
AAVAWWRSGMRGLRQCVAPQNVFNIWVAGASMFFSISSISLLKAFVHLDGAFIKLVGQVKLPLAAFCSMFVLGKRYSISQWLTMLIICCSCGCFTALRQGIHNASGLPAVCAMVGCNVLATLFAERAFKKRNALPFEVTMTNMRVGEVLVAFFLLFLEHGNHGFNRFFVHWDASTLWVLGTHVLDIWMTAFMVVKLSSVSKYLSKCMTMLVLFGIAVWNGRNGRCTPASLPEALVALIIILSTLQFSALASERSKRLKEAVPR